MSGRLSRHRRHSSRIRAIAIAMTIALVFMSAGGCSTPEEEPTDTISMTLGVSKEAMAGLAYLARDYGTFAANGLDVEFVEYSSSQLSFEALTSGEVDAAFAADTPIVTGALEGASVLIIATASTHENDIQIAARASAGIHEPADLAGKRIGTREGTAAHFFLHSFLVKYGMSDQDVQTWFDSFENVAQALIDGRIDAAALREPQLSQAAAALRDDLVLFEEPGLYEKSMNLCVAGGERMPDIATRRRLVAALLDAEALAVRQGPEQTRADIADALGIPAEQIQEGIVRDGSVSLGQSLLMMLEYQARWARSSGIVRAAREVDFQRIIDPTALKSIAPERVTVVG